MAVQQADCIFCRIVGGEIPAEIVERTERVVAFRDLDPKAPTHLLLVPTEHVTSVTDLADRHGPMLAELAQTASRLAEREGLTGGWRLVANVGLDAGQSVFHLHVHLLGGRRLGWPPG
jgi:histidine triad (HIT) family protein